jgi:dTDP-4-dehydrorhamnose reductase
MPLSPEAGPAPLEIWGGIECTVVKIGDDVRDQIAETGHRGRIGDLDAVASLGVRTLRYPVLWEHVSPDRPDRADFSWHDPRMARLRELGIRPIAGLVHHGSGPRYTGLLDPAFPEMLAAHAARVAERYPWVEHYTPVNEPLTTARFSGLYGHWAPHGRDRATFLRCLAAQCRATALAMRAIRRVRPDAKLVQTDDLGRIFSTPLLAYQARRENERRWLGFDLLCGRVDRHHPWHRDFLEAGVGDEALAPLRGGNHRHRYADAEAVRLDWPAGATGTGARLREAWERYGLPMAVTEAHHGSTRDEQVRWLAEVWEDAQALRAEGADVRAVTVWSLFGAVDWNSLLTRRAGFYEPGPFDVRSDPPRPTALAAATRGLARDGRFDHPVLDRPGWWHRPERLYAADPACAPRRPCAARPRPILVAGATGTLGRAFVRICALRGLDAVATTRAEMDIADPASVAGALARIRPWAVVNAAGYVRAADAAREPDRCMRENAHGAAALAEACARAGVPHVAFSSDLVFDGRLGRPYVESDATAPACVYGASKAEAERRVVQAHPDALVVRTSAFFGPWDAWNFVHRARRALRERGRFEADADAEVSPTYVPDLVHAALDLLIDGASGVWHLANRGADTWHGLALRAARAEGVDPAAVAPLRTGARRSTALASERGQLLPTLDDAFDRYLREAAA